VTKVSRVQYFRVDQGGEESETEVSVVHRGWREPRGCYSMRGCDDSHAVEGFTYGKVPTLYDELVSCKEEKHLRMSILERCLQEAP
jgi:hypothetical protein